MFKRVINKIIKDTIRTEVIRYNLVVTQNKDKILENRLR